MEWIDLINGPGGVTVVLTLILLGGVRGWWVFGREIDRLDARYEAALLDVRTDRDDWKEMALNGTQLANKAVDVAAKGRKP